MADARSFARGRAYLDAGRVRKLAVDGTTVTAIVEGTSAYRVRLAVTRAGLDATCSCPYGSEGVFCKHCVAAALAWLDGGGELGEPAQQPVPERELREFLLAQDTAWLTDELLHAAQADPLLCARLTVAAGAQAHDAYDDRALRTRLERAIQIRDFVDYRVGHAYETARMNSARHRGGRAGSPGRSMETVRRPCSVKDSISGRENGHGGPFGSGSPSWRMFSMVGKVPP
jgi:hypothetical protein